MIDPQTGMPWQQVVGPVLTIGAAILSWSILRNIKGIDGGVKRVEGKIDRVETDVRQLASTTGSHGERLAAGNARFEAIEKAVSERHTALSERVTGIESRERQRERECFERHAAAGYPAHTPVPRNQG